MIRLSLIALIIWLVDRREKRRKVKADGRLAAQLVYTETIRILAHLAVMKNRLYARADKTQDEWDAVLVFDIKATLAFLSALAPKVRSERLERMLESNTSLTPALSEAVADMLAATLVAVDSALLIFSMSKEAAYTRLNELRAGFEDAYEATRRAQTTALARSREGRKTPHAMQVRMKKAAEQRQAGGAPAP
ncbi:hypothetical protein XthCFBP4691_01205 [Xanthomonas theicola]|uniref:Uncharacterized protein n=1 Tax=Xanthomonas theicola TaxID=56464 RepID=A0A2S6ZLV6_9XANT|nr:hypothetical protein [Xanthomonas theicola]PPT93257.1 hypothetical protein XthCFBP4691_01205 [Xanthomonas theicola]QNH24806.1 hypothetical protein G4Q83_08685 [Xanthomonas theicola]